MKTVFNANKNKRVYDFYNDSGHGWLKVTRTELQRLDLMPLISSYSYQKGPNVFLEEDCDTGLFIKAKRLKDNIEIKFNEHSSNYSKIRSYQYFHMDLIDVALRDIVRAQKIGINMPVIKTSEVK